MSRSLVLLLSALLLPLMAACAGSGGSGPWQKPGVGEEEKAKDMFGCRDYARERIRSRAVRQTETEHSQAVAAQEPGRSEDLSGLRLIHEAGHQKLERRFFDECMRANGYRRADGG